MATTVVTTVAGQGSAGFADGKGAVARFNYPTGVALARDASFALVGDYNNHRIRKIDLTTSAFTVSTIAGS